MMNELNGIFAQLQQGNQDAQQAAQAATQQNAALLAQVQAQVQQAQQAAQAAIAAVQGDAQQPPPPTQFARSPGQSNPGNLIDYTTTTGFKLWTESIAPLATKFTAEGKDVNAFAEAIVERANRAGWNAQGGNIIDVNVNNELINLLTQYGRLTTDQIRAHCNTYFNQNNRQAQNDQQMYTCIKNSLTPDTEKKILAERDKYHINHVPCGPLLYKLLLQKAIVDNRATSNLMRANLTELVPYMETIDYNIELFNEYVKLNYEGLNARGEVCSDIIIYLFKAYLTVTNPEFIRYMQLKKIEYDDGTYFSVVELMTLALSQYTTISNSGKWNAKSETEEQLLALSAKIDEIKDTNLKLAKALQAKKSESKKPAAKKPSKPSKKSGKKSDKNKNK